MHFPVTNSNLSAFHLGLFLKEKYALGAEARCQLIRAGINDTYLVTDGHNKYVFRVYSLDWRSRTEIAEEIRLLNQLRDNSISVSYALPDKENNFIQILNAPEGDRFAVLFTYAYGEKLHSVAADVHFRIGELMARLHQVTCNQTLDRVHYTAEIILIESLKKLERFLPENTDEMQFMRSTQQYLLQEFAEADNPAIRKGIVHLDIWYDNLNITSDNGLTIFDFDFCGNGWLCFDISYYVLQLHSIEKYEEQNYQPKIESFIKGYESVTKISDEEKALIPMLGLSLYFFYLGVQCQRYDNWSNSFLSENYLKRFINGLVKRYYAVTGLGMPD